MISSWDHVRQLDVVVWFERQLDIVFVLGSERQLDIDDWLSSKKMKTTMQLRWCSTSRGHRLFTTFSMISSWFISTKSTHTRIRNRWKLSLLEYCKCRKHFVTWTIYFGIAGTEIQIIAKIWIILGLNPGFTKTFECHKKFLLMWCQRSRWFFHIHLWSRF